MDGRLGPLVILMVGFWTLEGFVIQRAPVTVETCTNVTIVTRQEWGARPSRAINHMNTPVTVVFMHHTAMAECFNFERCANETRIIQNFHMDVRGWDDIGYNFLIGEDGRVYEGRGWDRIGAHTRGWNDVAVAFSIMGDYTNHLPNDAALTAVENMIECGVRMGKLTSNYKLYGHRDVGNTECPGDALYKLIRTWSHYDHNKPVKPTPTPPRILIQSADVETGK